jgi:hypothetical protein
MNCQFMKRTSLGNGLFANLSQKGNAASFVGLSATTNARKHVRITSSILDTRIVDATGHRSGRRKDRKTYARLSLTDVEGWGIGALMLAAFFWVLGHLL